MKEITFKSWSSQPVWVAWVLATCFENLSSSSTISAMWSNLSNVKRSQQCESIWATLNTWSPENNLAISQTTSLYLKQRVYLSMPENNSRSSNPWKQFAICQCLETTRYLSKQLCSLSIQLQNLSNYSCLSHYNPWFSHVLVPQNNFLKGFCSTLNNPWTLGR